MPAPPRILRRHENEENGAVIGNLHGGMAERRAGSGGTSAGTEASLCSRYDAPLAAAAISARRRWRRALRLTGELQFLGGADIWEIDSLLTHLTHISSSTYCCSSRVQLRLTHLIAASFAIRDNLL